MHSKKDFKAVYDKIHKHLVQARKEMILLMAYGEISEAQMEATEELMKEFFKVAKKVIAASKVQ